MKYCKYCASALDDDAKYCTSCGAKAYYVKNEETTSNSNTTTSNSNTNTNSDTNSNSSNGNNNSTLGTLVGIGIAGTVLNGLFRPRPPRPAPRPRPRPGGPGGPGGPGRPRGRW